MGEGIDSPPPMWYDGHINTQDGQMPLINTPPVIKPIAKIRELVRRLNAEEEDGWNYRTFDHGNGLAHIIVEDETGQFVGEL